MTDRKPPPTGVVTGPLSATRFCRTDSMTESGSGEPVSLATSRPACWISQSMETPAAEMTCWVASTTSGPIPSPGIRVTWWAMLSV